MTTYKTFTPSTVSAMGAEGSVWHVPHLKEVGLHKSADTGTCYVRSQSVSMWRMLCEKLESTREKTCWIQGPPGVGKSTELFGWLMHVAPRQNSVLWVHQIRDDRCRVIMKDGDRWRMGLGSSIKSFQVPSYVDIVVLDGLREDMIATVEYFKYVECPFIICCTSYGRTHLSSEMEDLLNFDIPFQMLSWEKEEYERAIRQGVMITDVNDNTGEECLDARGELTRLCQDRLDKKFHLAGLSMRLMQMPTEKLVEYLQWCLMRVENFSAVLQGLTGFRTSEYVHSLMGVRAEDPKKSCVVSKYVLIAMSDRVSLTFVEEARAILPNNPSWQGWVFELEVIVRLRHNKCLCVRANDVPTAMTFSASYIVTYDLKTNASGEYWRSLLMRHNTICIPTQWNNATFDFVHIAIDGDEDRYDVTFFIATTAATHRFDCQYVAQFLEVLFPLPTGVKKRPRYKVRVAFVVVVPKASVSFECVQEDKVSVQNYDGTFTGAITTELVCD